MPNLAHSSRSILVIHPDAGHNPHALEIGVAQGTAAASPATAANSSPAALAATAPSPASVATTSTTATIPAALAALPARRPGPSTMRAVGTVLAGTGAVGFASGLGLFAYSQASAIERGYPSDALARTIAYGVESLVLVGASAGMMVAGMRVRDPAEPADGLADVVVEPEPVARAPFTPAPMTEAVVELAPPRR